LEKWSALERSKKEEVRNRERRGRCGKKNGRTAISSLKGRAEGKRNVIYKGEEQRGVTITLGQPTKTEKKRRSRSKKSQPIDSLSQEDETFCKKRVREMQELEKCQEEKLETEQRF